MCCKSGRALSRLGIIWGLFALVTLLIAFISGSWLYTKEPVTLPNSDLSTYIRFRIGLWRVCYSVRRINTSIHVPSSACTLVKYAGWQDITHSDLGLWVSLDLAQAFISQMRSCTLLIGSAIILLLLAFFFALTGHCNTDNKTLIACGLYILGALSLGTGLVVFASALSEALIEVAQYRKETPSGPDYDYQYGWCFFTAGAAFIMTKIAAVFSLSGHLNRYPSVDEMVKEMVPGAERKLREYQQHSRECLVKRPTAPSQQYDFIAVDRPKYDNPECGPLLSKTPPDVCTSNKCMESGHPELSSAILLPGLEDTSFVGKNSLAGQTVPIKIKNHRSFPQTYANYPYKYGTMPNSKTCAQQAFLGISDLGSSSSNSSSGYCSKSKTLQHQRPRKKCVKIETFQSPESALAECSRRSTILGYSGSAV